MKPDGTYTVDEILQICNDQLQSWEREELVEKLGMDFIYSVIRNMDVDELANVSGYYVYEDEPEPDLECVDIEDLIDTLEEEINFTTLTKREERRIRNLIHQLC